MEVTVTRDASKMLYLFVPSEEQKDLLPCAMRMRTGISAMANTNTEVMCARGSTNGNEMLETRIHGLNAEKGAVPY